MLSEQIKLKSIFKHFKKVLKVLTSPITQVLAPYMLAAINKKWKLQY